MVKRKSKVNKAAEIRQYYLDHPNAKPSEIVAAMAKRKIEVSAQQVSTTRMNAVKAGQLPANGSTVKVVGAKKRGRPAGSTKSKTMTQTKAKTKAIAKRQDDSVSVTALVEAKKLIEKVGMDNAKNAIMALEQLQS